MQLLFKKKEDNTQGLKLAVSRYPRDTKILFWILTADLLVSRWDTTTF